MQEEVRGPVPPPKTNGMPASRRHTRTAGKHAPSAQRLGEASDATRQLYVSAHTAGTIRQPSTSMCAFKSRIAGLRGASHLTKMVTRFAWIAQRLESSNRWTRYASHACDSERRRRGRTSVSCGGLSACSALFGLAHLLQRCERLYLPSFLAVCRRRIVRVRDLSHLRRERDRRSVGSETARRRKHVIMECGAAAHQAREGQLTDEQIGRTLVPADLPQCDRVRPATMAGTSKLCLLLRSGPSV